MPLSRLQSQILRLLAAHRDPESYVAGSTPLNRGGCVLRTTLTFSTTARNGWPAPPKRTAQFYKPRGLRLPGFVGSRQFIRRRCAAGDERTHLEWVADSDFRFFPTLKDELFGYVLHPIDLATNKVMAAAGRRKPADVVDLVAIHDEDIALGRGDLGGGR